MPTSPLPGVTTLPIAPHLFWPLAQFTALLLAVLVVYAILTAIGRKERGPIWSFVEDLLPATNRRQALALGAVVTVLFLAACVAALAILWQTLVSLYAPLQPSPDNKGVNLGGSALLAAFLGAPFVIWGTVLKHQTVRYQKEGHITDRISKAVEQLGAEKTEKVYSLEQDGIPVQAERTLPNIEVRIGAILSLERIAQDSTKHDKGRDHVRVIEILCAYIRENAPAKGAVPGPYDGLIGDEAIDRKVDISPDPWLETLPAPRADIQIALTVLGRRSKDQIKIEKSVKDKDGKPQPYKLDLRHTNLRLAVFEGGDFASAIFYRSRLEGAYMNGGDFSDCDFTYSALTGIGASDATFNKARFKSADLSYAVCDGAQFLNVIVTLTHFVKAQLTGSTMGFPYSSDPFNRPIPVFCLANLEHVRLSGDLRAMILTLPVLDNEQRPSRGFRVGLRSAALDRQAGIYDTELYLRTPFNALPLTFGDASVTLAEEADRPAHWPRWVLPNTGPHSYEAEYQKWLADPQGYTPPPPPA